MKSLLKPEFCIWSVALVVSISLLGLTIRSLALAEVPLSESLFLRGLASLIVTGIWAKAQALSLKPRSIKIQFVRAVVAGLALTFVTASYRWLSASAVSVLSNADIPLLVLLGSRVGQVSSMRAKTLSFVSIVLLIVYGLGIQSQPNWPFGVSSLFIGLILLCFGYSFIKKSMQQENRAITTMTPALAIMVYGVFQKTGEPLIVSINWSSYLIILGILSGLAMFGAYYATMKLYEVADIAIAEFPTLLASLVIQPAEAVLFHQSLEVNPFVLTVIFIFVTYFILKNDQPAILVANVQ